MDRSRFRSLLESLPEEVLRVKGIVRFCGVDHPVYFQRTESVGSVELLPIRQRGGFDLVVVLIGVCLDHAALTGAFRSL